MFSGATRTSHRTEPGESWREGVLRPTAASLKGRGHAPIAEYRVADLPGGERTPGTRGGVCALRVLVVAFQTGRQADGGVESLTQLLERYEGLNVTVLTHAQTAKNDRWRRKGWRVLVWPWGDAAFEPVRWSGARIWQYVRWNLRAAWQAWRDDVAVAHVNDPLALWHVVFGLRLVGVPVVFNIRDTKARVSAREVWKWRGAFRLTQAQVVLSQEMRSFWQRALAVAGRQLIAVYSVVDTERMLPLARSQRLELRERLGFPDGLVIGYIASFSEKKAQLRFIENAGRALLQLVPACHVYFLGDFAPEADRYAAACERSVRELGLASRFIFKGFVAQPEAWYPAFDMVVVATQNEGLARCMIESLASGTPVVSFDVCSAREMLEAESCGLVVPQGDYIGLVAALAGLAERGADRRRMGQTGAALARRLFDPKVNVEQYLAIYRTLADAGRVV